MSLLPFGYKEKLRKLLEKNYGNEFTNYAFFVTNKYCFDRLLIIQSGKKKIS